MAKKGKGIALGAAAVVLLCLGGGIGFGAGSGGEGGTGAVPETAVVQTDPSVPPVETTQATKEAVRETAAVTVAENGYFYENRSIELPELLEQLAAEDCLVEITDENASLKAYNALLQGLQERGILYVENFPGEA